MSSKHAAIYARYSPGRDRDKTSTIEAQVAMCQEKAHADNATINEAHVYIDRGISGATVKRDAFQQMLSAIEEGSFPDILYAKDDKRLFRNEREAGELVEWIWEHDVEIRYCLVSFGDPRASDEQWFMQRQFHLFAELERRRKAKEVFEHQRQNALQGFANGGLPPYGYQRKEVFVQDETGTLKKKLKWEIDPDTAPAVARAFEMFLDGKGSKVIADELTRLGFRSRRGNPMNKVSLLEWFRRPFVFAGCTVWNMHDKQQHPKPREEWILVDDAHEAIITMEQAEEAYAKMEANRRGKKKLSRSGDYTFSGLMRCSECGAAFVMNSYKKRDEAFYVCGSRRRAEGCENSLHLDHDRLEDQITDYIKETIVEPGFVENYLEQVLETAREKLEESAKERERLQRAIERCDDRIRELVNALADRRFPRDVLAEQVEAEEQQKAELERELARLPSSLPSTPPDLDVFRQELAEALDDPETKKAAIRGLIESIVVHPDATLDIDIVLGQTGTRTGSATRLPGQCRFETGERGGFRIRVAA